MRAKINPNIFRAYDIRGVYPRDLNGKIASRVALAFVRLYPQAKTFVVAHDTRKSSPVLAKAIIDSLVSAGKSVVFLKTAPDPLFYFSIFYYRYDAGIMITGSHNTPEYNGLSLHIRKTIQAKKGDVILGEIEKIKKLVAGGRDLKIKTAKPGKVINLDPVDAYLEKVVSGIKLSRSLKILVDSGNGAMGYLPEKVFKKLGCRVKTIFGDFDGNFPNHLPDPYERKNCLIAAKEIVKGGFDVGFVYDGDGDRVGVIDGKGRLVSGDDCLLILSRQALESHQGPIVHDARVSKAFLDEMKQRGVKTYFSVSYHGAIIRKIKEIKAVFGGEITLHFLFPRDYYLCDEALFASLKLAQIVSGQNNFAGYIDSLPHYFASPEIFIPCADGKKFKIIKKLQQYLRKNKYDFVSIDGARINFSNGWALARAANTSPFIKCRFEGKTKEDLKEIKLKSLAIFQKIGIPVTGKVYDELELR
ncbi:MAG: phosphomannomutase/phosphoglucomutase [bacterium]|nr:phosphomannomutase/phosphoglucomutase [bacterium]